MQIYDYKCFKCNTREAPNWITIVNSLDDNKYTILCPKCWEEEAINAI